ncbi:MAG: hypothetical protein JWL59_1380 [Chthoniobacteraceae bacterium]|nr:hypothetical protein [Chthoniobacteraceae bacterium]
MQASQCIVGPRQRKHANAEAKENGYGSYTEPNRARCNAGEKTVNRTCNHGGRSLRSLRGKQLRDEQTLSPGIGDTAVWSNSRRPGRRGLRQGQLLRSFKSWTHAAPGKWPTLSARTLSRSLKQRFQCDSRLSDAVANNHAYSQTYSRAINHSLASQVHVGEVMPNYEASDMLVPYLEEQCTVCVGH